MTAEYLKTKKFMDSEFKLYVLVDRTKDQVDYDLYLEKQKNENTKL